MDETWPAPLAGRPLLETQHARAVGDSDLARSARPLDKRQPYLNHQVAVAGRLSPRPSTRALLECEFSWELERPPLPSLACRFFASGRARFDPRRNILEQIANGRTDLQVLRSAPEESPAPDSCRRHARQARHVVFVQRSINRILLSDSIRDPSLAKTW